MANMKQFRARDASLWQSAVDEVVAKENAASSPAAGLAAGARPVSRPAQGLIEIQRTNEIAEAIDARQVVPAASPPSAAGCFWV